MTSTTEQVQRVLHRYRVLAYRRVWADRDIFVAAGYKPGDKYVSLLHADIGIDLGFSIAPTIIRVKQSDRHFHIDHALEREQFGYIELDNATNYVKSDR